MIRRVRAFGLFWWDFLVGDSPELALGGLLILGMAFALHQSIAIAAIAVPVAVILLLGISVWRGQRTR